MIPTYTEADLAFIVVVFGGLSVLMLAGALIELAYRVYLRKFER